MFGTTTNILPVRIACFSLPWPPSLEHMRLGYLHHEELTRATTTKYDIAFFGEWTTCMCGVFKGQIPRGVSNGT